MANNFPIAAARQSEMESRNHNNPEAEAEAGREDDGEELRQRGRKESL